MSIPSFFSQAFTNSPVTTAAHLASTAGSILTICDIALVNGANQLNIVSIVRTGNVAVVETATAHPYQLNETLHLESTGEANFNGKFKIFQLLTPTTFSIKVANTGALSTGAVGTVKQAAAGWTKTVIATNVAAYHSAPYPDGLVRTIQIEDNSPFSNTYEFRVRLAVGWTALNTATKISTARKYTKVNTNSKWAVIADDKTVQMFFAGTTNYYIGEALGLESTDNNVSVMSTGTDGGIYGAQFGAQSFSPLAQTLGQTACCFLESPFSLLNDVFAAVSLLGSPSINTLTLATVQNNFLYSNPINGKFTTSPVDIWEKKADAGQTHFPRARAKGLFQPIGRLPVSILADLAASYYPIREDLVDGSVKDYVVFQTTSVTHTSSSHLTVDLNMW